MQTQDNKYLRVEEMKNYLLEIVNQKLEPEDCLILITRKGYWNYKVLIEQELQEKIGKKICVFSDRYLTKCLDFSVFAAGETESPKRIIIFDDTMNSGANLFFYYAYFRKKVQELVGKFKEIIPVTYALNVEYKFENESSLMIREYSRLCREEEWNEEKRTEAINVITDFNKVLQWKIRLTSESIAEIRNQEIGLFQDHLSPMVVDLPIASCMKKDGKYTLPAYMNHKDAVGIEVTTVQFEKMKVGNEQWEYVENQFKQQGIDADCSYFQFKESVAWGGARDVLHDCIVKCEYKKTDDGKIRLVFVPFAIMKSMTFRDVVSYFFELLDGTSYSREIYDFFGCPDLEMDEMSYDNRVMDMMKKNHNLCRNMYRTIIFYFSYFIFLHFKMYVKECAEIEIDFDWEFMKDSFSENFIKSFKETCEDSHYDISEFVFRFWCLPEAQEIDPVDIKIPENKQKKKADETSMVRMLDERLLEGKNVVDGSLRQRVYTIETMLYEFEKAYLFQSKQEEQKLTTKIIISMLETSRFGNEIYVDNKDMVIYRGFRYGENSELLFLPGMEYFYAYIYAFYYYAGKENYSQLYVEFINQVKTLFQKENYIGTLIEQDIFEFLRKYFGNLNRENVEELIMNKFFVLKFDGSEKGTAMNAFVKRVFNQVKNWM